MPDQVAISYASLVGVENTLSRISSNLSTLQNNQDIINRNVQTVSNNVNSVSSDLATLAHEFHTFVAIQAMRQRLSLAETRVVKLRQELDKKYGHYDTVRRMASGILEADDLGIVRKETMTQATENIMLEAPGYWLAPCLVALSAWIGDNKELSEKAIREALRRDDEKSSLFWTLVTMRADRREACLRWAERYMAAQDEEALSRNTIIILDAYAAGLLGSDTEGIIYKRINTWLERLTAKSGFAEAQRDQWSKAMLNKQNSLPAKLFPNLETYSPTWPNLKSVLERACLNIKLHKHFNDIFSTENATGPIKKELDKILASLVKNYDDEELPLRQEEHLEQLIIDYDGDEKRAKASMQNEKQSFEQKRDFTKLLTEAALTPELSHASISTQQFATALSKPWIMEAFNDIVATNRAKVPQVIEFSLDAKFAAFTSQTKDGRNEEDMLSQWKSFLKEHKDKLSEEIIKSTGSPIGCGITAALLFFFCLSFSIETALVVGGISAIIVFIMYNGRQTERQARLKKLDESISNLSKAGEEIIFAFCAEAVDFRAELAAREAEASKVTDLLNDIAPEQYVKKLASSTRRIKA